MCTSVQLARSLSTFVPVFPKARGLRLQSPSWCAELSYAPTTMPLPPLCEGIGNFVGVSLTYFPPSFASFTKSPVFARRTQTRYCRWRVFCLPLPLFAASQFSHRVHRFPYVTDAISHMGIASVLTTTATLLEHTHLTQGFAGTSKATFPRRLRPQNRDSTRANLANPLK